MKTHEERIKEMESQSEPHAVCCKLSLELYKYIEEKNLNTWEGAKLSLEVIGVFVTGQLGMILHESTLNKKQKKDFVDRFLNDIKAEFNGFLQFTEPYDSQTIQ